MSITKPESDEHIHYWLVDPPAGRYSMGHCACGEEKEFSNSVADNPWHPPVKAWGRNEKGRNEKPLSNSRVAIRAGRPLGGKTWYTQ